MSKFQFPKQDDVSWGRELPNGGEGGVKAWQIDASGPSVQNYILYDWTLPVGNAPAVRASWRVKSTLVSNNVAFEGFGARFRGFNALGVEVWDSKPEEQGVKAWFAQSTDDEWVDAVFTAKLPTDEGIEYISVEGVVKTASGQITVCKPECRYHYAVPYDISIIGSKSWTSGFSVELIAEGIDTDADVYRWSQYARTIEVDIPKGKQILVTYKGDLSGRAFEENGSPGTVGYDAQRLAASIGIMIKLRRIDGANYENYTLFNYPVSVEGKTVFADGSIPFKSEYHYDQAEVVCFVEAGPNTEGYTSRSVDKLRTTGNEIEIIVADYLTPTQ